MFVLTREGRDRFFEKTKKHVCVNSCFSRQKNEFQLMGHVHCISLKYNFITWKCLWIWIWISCRWIEL